MTLRALVFSCLIILSACAPQIQPERKVSEYSGKVGTDSFYAADGLYLPMRSWLPKQKPKAVILALHGFNDYSRAFESTGQFFKKRGVAVYAYDQRGFGASPMTGVWAGADALKSDVFQAVRQLKNTHPHTPIYILGESMGGAVAIAALTAPDAPKVGGLILSAPALWGQDSMHPLYRGALWTMAHTLPRYELTGSSLKILASNNIPMLRRLGADPLIIKATRVDAIYGLVHMMDAAYGALPELKTRTLLLYGHEDQVIRKEAMMRALPRFGTPIDVAYYPDGYHMLLRDIQGKQVMEDIASWISRPKAPLPSGFGERYNPADKR
ncbi:MAG: alpha/beta hydrolase [Alphaproteobacteria bacterium]|nr:alpha/beta hydrolase [Alphaproteobacteria bacterium]